MFRKLASSLTASAAAVATTNSATSPLVSSTRHMYFPPSAKRVPFVAAPSSDRSTSTTNENGEDLPPPEMYSNDGAPYDWTEEMKEKYGQGNFPLFRSIYRDLVDEMRSEATTKPPPPMKDWTIDVDESVNLVVARKAANTQERTGRVVVFATPKIGDPPRLNQTLQIADYYEMEAFVERNGVVLHCSLSVIEGGLYMRNVRVHKADALGPDVPDLLAVDINTLWARHRLLYDGPCLWHLESDMHSEFYDLLFDHGVYLDVVIWLTEWTYFAEHVATTRWMLQMMDALIPAERRGDESDFLTEQEVEQLSQPSEEWLPPRFA